MKPSIVVYGPAGCGKTRNAELLRKRLGLVRVIDEADHFSGPIPRCGALILTNNPDAQLFKRFERITFEEAMRSAEASS